MAEPASTNPHRDNDSAGEQRIVEALRRARSRSFSGRSTGAECACGRHRVTCLFGRMHSWTMPWFVQGRVVRTKDTAHCYGCGAVCTGDEEPVGDVSGTAAQSAPTGPLSQRAK
ncbi:hypothetical protein AN218_23130 [Streptomyces nanshensis]|uniref:Uncharacterized protein n=1 Tax=Streptomyces nanshensis TaxID=518642 RepID=A0A1E7KZI5_9ACTN|nr:hypothetical protein AN218_23130 [Streptomyces nanshensis]